MSAANINIIVIILAVIVAISITYLLYRYIFNKDYALSATKQMMTQDGSNMNYYIRLKRLISKTGIAFMTGKKMTPELLLLAQIGCAIFGLLIGLKVHIAFAIIITPIWFMAPILIMKASDAADNSNMETDIEKIMNILAIEIKNGAFLTDVLVDIFIQMSNRRLKQAISELITDINIDGKNINRHIDSFNAKFNNEQIEEISDILKQAVNTGSSIKIIDATKFKLQVIRSESEKREKARMERIIMILNIIMYVVMTIFILYSIVLSIGDMIV